MRRSKAAHQRAVKVARIMSLPVKRANPDHPSVIRAIQRFDREHPRSDTDLRRLPDLFRETAPQHVGLAANQWGGQQPRHRCKSLGTVMLASDVYAVTLCRKHREEQPSRDLYGRGQSVGVNWLRRLAPDLWASWRQANYRPVAKDRWGYAPRPDADPRQTYLRIRPFIMAGAV